jgi:polysaccharide deacetylase 2 family uncharacterized protein YibQ
MIDLFPSLPAWSIAWSFGGGLLVSGFGLLLLVLAGGAARAAELAIVMDDVGYSLHRGERILALPREVTLGMLPYAPHARIIAERAHASGREVILHQPMEALVARRAEPGTLEAGMSADRFDRQFEASLARLPQVIGVNNHTGSLLTARRVPMEWLMSNIAARGLFFLDSRTTPHTVAEVTARDWSVPTLRRDVFLDHVRTDSFLAASLAQGIAIARKKGHAVIIAHPYPITLAFLEERLTALPPDIELAALSSLVRPTGRTTLALLGNPGFPNISLGR